ncbi:hypothetical protein ACYATP_01785 [Lactobacillaceae bacterium Melli_B4]
MNAAKQIMVDASFKEVTFSNIAKLTKLSRPSIYKYYQFPEEILANILMNELADFNAQLKALPITERSDLTDGLVRIILKRDLMMELLALNFSIIKHNVRDDIFLLLGNQVAVFKQIINDQLLNVNHEITPDKVAIVQYALLTMMCSIYPLTHDDSYHVELMQQHNAELIKPSYEKLLTSEVELIFHDGLAAD